MKGLLGGYGSRATALVFDRCINVYHARARNDADFPRVLIYNLPSSVATTSMSNKDGLLKEAADGLRLLKQAGCHTIYMACNTLYTMRAELLDLAGLTEDELPDLPQRFINEHLSFFDNASTVICSRAFTDSCFYPGIYNVQNQAVIDMLISNVIRRPPTERDWEYLHMICYGKKTLIACTELSVIYWSMPEAERNELNVIDFADLLSRHLAY